MPYSRRWGIQYLRGSFYIQKSLKFSYIHRRHSVYILSISDILEVGLLVRWFTRGTTLKKLQSNPKFFWITVPPDCRYSSQMSCHILVFTSYLQSKSLCPKSVSRYFESIWFKLVSSTKKFIVLKNNITLKVVNLGSICLGFFTSQ